MWDRWGTPSPWSPSSYLTTSPWRARWTSKWRWWRSPPTPSPFTSGISPSGRSLSTLQPWMAVKCRWVNFYKTCAYIKGSNSRDIEFKSWDKNEIILIGEFFSPLSQSPFTGQFLILHCLLRVLSFCASRLPGSDMTRNASFSTSTWERRLCPAATGTS